MVCMEAWHWTGQVDNNYFPKFLGVGSPMLREVLTYSKHWLLLLANYNLELCFLILGISVREFPVFTLKTFTI